MNLLASQSCASIPLAVLRDLEQGGKENPWRALDEERAAALLTRSWPSYAFASRSVSVRAAVRAYGLSRYQDPDAKKFAIYLLNEFEVIAPWRVTRGVYCFDEALSLALADTSPATAIPVDVLTRLP